MGRYWAIGCLSLFGVILGLSRATPRMNEPVYAGKTLDQWLEGGYEQASMALQEIGPPAAPYVLAKLRCEDPRCGSLQKYRDLWRRLPPTLRKIFPRPKAANFDELHACSALLELGPRAVPFLSAGLKDYNPVVREVSAHALGSLRHRGNDIRIALPALVQALGDPSAEVRTRATWALDNNEPTGR